MNRTRKYEELISAYIDGALSGEDIRFVEETLLHDPEWKKRYEQMCTMRSTMRSLSSTGNRQSLWPALSRRIQRDERKAEKIEFIPAKLVPVMTVLAMIVVGLSSFLITRNWDAVTAYFDDTRSVVEDIYEQGIVRGALQPLFQGVTNDDLIQFAFSGVLEIPESDGQGLKVESETGEQFEIEFADARKANEMPSLSDLYSDLNVTAEQKRSIDSVLTNFKNIIQSSAFIADDMEVVLSPELAGLDRFIIASIAEHLVPEQRIVLNKVINRFNPEIYVPAAGPFPHYVAYADPPGVRIGVTVPHSPDNVSPQVRVEVRDREKEVKYPQVARKTNVRTFIVLRPDTVITREFEIPDFSQLAAQRIDAEKIQRKVSEELAKTLHNTRINIKPQIDIHHDGQGVQVITRVDRPVEPGEVHRYMIKRDSLMLNQFHQEHFIRLRELSKMMMQGSEILRRRIPEFVDRDTIRIPGSFDPFDESFEQNMQQLEYDLNRLGEELEKMFEDPEKLILMQDSIFFNLFPDTLDQ